MFKEITRLADVAPEGEEHVVAALLSAEDFVAACAWIGGFERWANYDDFLLDTEGLVMGLAMAGKHGCSLQVSLSAFADWLQHSGEAPTLDALDRFAQSVHRFRRSRAECLPAPQAVLFEIVLPTLDRYEEWLETLNSLDGLSLWNELPGPELYAELLLEYWSF